METATFAAPDISCEHCRTTIEREVGALSGVQVCSVDVPHRQVSVVYDPALVSRRGIMETLEEEGYPVTG